MSVQAITWALGRAPSIAAQAVLFSLANHADEWGITFVGRDTVARECACRAATVTANLAKLQDEGLIRRFERRPGGRRTSDVIVLAPEYANRGEMADADRHARSFYSADVCAAARGTRGAPSLRNEGSVDVSQGTPHVSQGALGVPEPSEEPSEEPSKETERASAIHFVWAHYQEVVPNGERYQLDPQRRQIISKALDVRPVQECCQAVDGLMRSDYHRKNRYIDIRYALLGGGRNPSREATIDRMCALAVGRPANGHHSDRGSDTIGHTRQSKFGHLVKRDEYVEPDPDQDVH